MLCDACRRRRRRQRRPRYRRTQSSGTQHFDMRSAAETFSASILYRTVEQLPVVSAEIGFLVVVVVACRSGQASGRTKLCKVAVCREKIPIKQNDRDAIVWRLIKHTREQHVLSISTRFNGRQRARARTLGRVLCCVI